MLLSPIQNPRQHIMLRGIAWLAPQTVIGKGISNPLITEGLLKIQRELILPVSSKSLVNSLP